MKLAILADIHGNYAALEAVAEHIRQWWPDSIVVAGDVVNRGPRSDDCWALVQERHKRDGWQLIRGNHEDYVINVARDPSERPGIEGAIRASVGWTARRLDGQIDCLAALDQQISLRAPDGGEIRIVHASMRHNRDNILVDTPDHQLRQQIAPAPPLFCCGHTHRALIRRIDSTLVVNAGSVGMPFDGDPRACYAQLIWQEHGWEARIVRLPYDRQQTMDDFVTSGFLDNSGPVAHLIFDEFQTARPRLFRWTEQYRAAVLAGELSVEQSVSQYLAQLGPDRVPTPPSPAPPRP